MDDMNQTYIHYKALVNNYLLQKNDLAFSVYNCVDRFVDIKVSYLQPHGSFS